MTSLSSRLTQIFSFCAGGLALSVATPAWAEQFVLMDVEFTFTKEQADNSQPSPSHYYVTHDMLEAGQPTDWTAPVDYRNGKVHIRTQVIDKPAGSEVTQWSLCYIPNQGIGQGYGCTNSGTYTEEGVYERNELMTSWWENTSIDWTKGIKEMHLVIKDSDSGQGHAHKRPDHEKFFPTTVRITMVQVAAGSTYDESLVPPLGDGTDGSSSSGGASGVGGSGASTGGTTSGAGGSPSGGETASGGAPGGDAGAGGGSGGSSGCAWQPAASGSSWAWLGALALGGAALARRRRAASRG